MGHSNGTVLVGSGWVTFCEWEREAVKMCLMSWRYLTEKKEQFCSIWILQKNPNWNTLFSFNRKAELGVGILILGSGDLKIAILDYLYSVTTFTDSKPWQHLFYSSLWSNRSQLIIYDILTVLSVSSTADFPHTDYFSHDYSSWLIIYDILSQIDLVCAPDLLVYKPSVQTVFL